MTAAPGPAGHGGGWIGLARALAALRAAFPGYEVWTYEPCGEGRLRYAAQRRAGADGQPYAAVSTDAAELRAALSGSRYLP